MRSTLRSRIVTSACIPAAMKAALNPTIPPPITITFAGQHAGHPAHQTPAPAERLQQIVGADLRRQRPATSLIGASSGSRRSGVSTVS